MNQNIGAAEQAFENYASTCLSQIQTGAALAERNIRHDGGFIPVWRIDSQDISAETCKEPGRDWAREHRQTAAA